MAVEQLRRSGYRQVGGIYLVSDTFIKCDPFPLPECKYCGRGINLSRNVTEIKFGENNGDFIVIVGKHFYPTIESFIEEAERLGVSKRVPFVAKNIVLNETKLFLAHPLAYKKDWGIFGYFIPTRVETLIWNTDGIVDDAHQTYRKKYPEAWKIIKIPSGDLDHSPWKKKKLLTVSETSNII